MAESETYRSVDDADRYFADQLYATDWTGASDDDKSKALLMASRAVDSLKYDGVKRSVWEALIADGGDATKTTDYLLSHTDLTELELEAADALQLKQFPRDDERNAEAWLLQIDATGGTYDLTLNGETASGIAYDASAATVQAALEGLASISAGDVTVTGTYTITLGGDYATTWWNSLTSDASNLTGGATTAAVTVVEDNVPDPIHAAVCEEAKSLLSGRDAEQEFRNLELNSDGVGTNRVTMDRSGIHPEHSHHLVTSPLAWKYIQRFLANNNTFRIKRS
jgi:hypothetical protein